MFPWRYTLVVLGALVGCAWGAGPASAQERTALPSRQHATTPMASVPVKTLPTIDGAALRAKANAEADKSRPYRFGKAVATDYSPDRHGTWERLSSGAWLWRLRIQSQNAVSLNLGFKHFQLPAGAKLFVYRPDTEAVHGPYGNGDATDGQLWTPVVSGSEAVVELKVPETKRSDASFRIEQVSHGFRSLNPATSKKADVKAQACNIDVACPQADPWNDQVRSVGLYSVNGVDLCSGSLINNTSGDGTPYFLTAEHCLKGSEEAAASMVFYWNYQHPTCRPQGGEEELPPTTDDQSDQTSSGAILRMSYGNVETENQIAGKPDVTLVEIDEEIPASYDLYLNGWDRRDFAPSEAVSIHHPSTDGKRITFERDPTVITGLGDPSDDTHIRVEWDDGTTEQGSSGGPLFDSSQQTVGVLSVGGIGCEVQDWYGRIHNAWDGGGTPETQLRNWLDPVGTRTQTLSGRPIADDTISPALIPDLSVKKVTPTSVKLQWTAPGDDGMNGTADRYLLRYRASTPQRHTDATIETQSDFEAATRVSSVPSTAPAGTIQSATVDVSEDSSYYFALVAVDEVLNASPIATVGRDVTPVGDLQVTAPAPNPARNQTRLRVVTEKREHVQIRLYDALGRRVSLLFNDEIDPYRQIPVPIDVSSLSSGMYFARIRASDGRTQTRKISVVR